MRRGSAKRPRCHLENDDGRTARRMELAAVAVLVVLGGAVLLAAMTGAGEAGASAVDPADLSLTKADSPHPVAENAVLTYP